MELINQTPVPAKLRVSEMSDEPGRAGMLVAKATFEVPQQGMPQLVTEDPLPLLEQPTPLDDLGDLPMDFVLRDDPTFEVFLLGACYAPYGRPVRQMFVSMTLGAVTRHLVVWGDRVWVGQGNEAHITPAAEFERIPLTYERAFGGSAEIQIDPHSVYPVFEPMNQRGRGFDPQDYAAGCAAQFECPPGYPTVLPTPRQLPNLEDPHRPIRTWSDHPLPHCWAPIPIDAGFKAHVMHARLAQYGKEPPPPVVVQAGFLSAHPDWTFPQPPAINTVVGVHGVHPTEDLSFVLPRLRVLADYEIGPRQGVLELKPQALVILAEKRRFCVVYRALFRFQSEPEWERSFRLRLVDGWNGVS